MKFSSLHIYTKDLSKIVGFYEEVLGFVCINEERSSVSFQIGSSTLTFEERKDATPYHFALNIPCNQELEAHDWLKERVPLLKQNDTAIYDFDFWNATAMYFLDPDNNIVELIARKNLTNPSSKSFTTNSILSVCEIGVPCDDIPTVYAQLNESCQLEKFSGDFDSFCAIGVEGLIISINKNKRNWFPIDAKAYSSDFSLLFDFKNESFTVDYINGKLQVN